jgi:hypothetical protein
MGFMKVVLSLVSWIVVLVACYIATPIVAEGIVKHTPLAEVIHETVNEKVNIAIDEAMEGAAGALSDAQIAEINEKIPEQLRNMLYGYGKTLEDFITTAGDIELDTSYFKKYDKDKEHLSTNNSTITYKTEENEKDNNNNHYNNNNAHNNSNSSNSSSNLNTSNGSPNNSLSTKMKCKSKWELEMSNEIHFQILSI